MRLVVSMLFSTIFFLAAASAAAALEVAATVDRTRIGLSESVMLSVTASGESPEVDTRVITDFRVLSQGRQSSISIINNQVTRQTVFRYTLIPLKTGALQIPPLAVAAGSENARTRPISITVSAKPPDEVAQDIIVSAEVSESRPFVGQQIVYTFRLQAGARFANARFQAPAFDGFSAKEVEGQKQYQQIVNGKHYQVTELRFVLFPLESGKNTIAPAELTCDVPSGRLGQTQRAQDPVFGNPFFGGTRMVTRAFRTQPLTIDVAPLPPYDGTPMFSGLVGRFTLEAALDGATLPAGDSATLTVTIAGSGNLQDAGPPPTPLPEGFKGYDDAPEEAITVGENGFSGKKVFRTAVVPTAPGAYLIPSISMVVFDTGTGNYRRLETKPIPVTVTAAREENAPIVVSAAPEGPALPEKQKVALVGRDILPLKTDPSALEAVSPLSPYTFTGLAALPPVVYLLVLAWLSISRRNGEVGEKLADKARQSLMEAGSLLSENADSMELLTVLRRALMFAVFSAAGREGASLTYDEAGSMLVGCGVSEPIAEEVETLMRRIDTAVYGGEVPAMETAREFDARVRTVINQLVKQK